MVSSTQRKHQQQLPVGGTRLPDRVQTQVSAIVGLILFVAFSGRLSAEPPATDAAEPESQPTQSVSPNTPPTPALQIVNHAQQVAEQTPKIDLELEGKTITRVGFTCDLPVCKTDSGVRAFAEISGLQVGQPFSTTRLRFGEERLAKTGFFEALEVEKRLVPPESVEIDIKGKGATLIRRVGFDGVSAPPFESEIRKIVNYRQGQRFLGNKGKATAQLDSIRTLYEREGYFGTQIDMRVKRVENEPHQVDIIFAIDKGDRREVCDVGIRGIENLNYNEARNLLLSDFSTLPSSISLFPTYFTQEGFKLGRETLVKHFRKRGYFQMRVVQAVTDVRPNSKCVDLLIDAVEGPRWTIEFSGNTIWDNDQLLENLPFFESGYVDVQEIRRAELQIKRQYESGGYPFTQVTGRETRTSETERVILFEIDEGEQFEITNIRFEGNQSIPDSELRAVMKTKTFGLFETGGFLQTDKLLGDLSSIEALYQSKGWLKASVNAFEVETKPGELVLVVAIDEGNRVEVERIDIDGNRAVSDGMIERDLVSKTGEPFVALNLKADLSKLKQRYASFGYPMMTIQTECHLLTGEQVVCEAPRRAPNCVARTLDDLDGLCQFDSSNATYRCQRVRQDSKCEFTGGVQDDRVRLLEIIDEGPRVKVGAILLKGNFDTDSSIVFRELAIARDDLLDTNRLLESQSNLRSLNLFDSVSIETIGLDGAIANEDQGVAALLVTVEEARTTKSLDFKFGFELRELLTDNFQFLLTGEATYSDRNLFGQGFGLQPRVIAAVDTLDMIRLATDQAFTDGTNEIVDFLFGAEIILSHPRFMKSFFGIDKLYATFAPFYLIDRLGIINRQVLREEGGIRIEFRKELQEILNRFFLKIGFEVKTIASFAPDGPIIDGERVFSPRRTIGKFTPELRLDRRDSPLNPKKGFLARVEPSLVSGDAFGQGGESFFQDSFLKLTIGFSYYVSPWDGFVLAQGIRAGQIFPLFGRENPVQADERYFLGGVRSVRGFPEGSLGAVGTNQLPSGGEFLLNYNAEIRYPLVRDFGIYGATFFDLGLLSDCRDALTDDRNCYATAFGGDGLSNLRPSAGIGLRALILDQIPVVLDYGVVLDRNFGEQFGEIHFNVGYTFD